MKNIKRVAIIGNAGSGKSTLSQELHHIFNLPVYHLDKYFWKPDWNHPDPEDYKTIHHRICNMDEWIMDGMNLRLLEYRINRADIIFFLDIPRYICFWRIFKRAFKYYGQVAPNSAAGCPEGIGWKFIQFLKWVWDFKKNYRPHIITLLKAHTGAKEIYIFKSSHEVNQFIEKLGTNNKLSA